MKNLSTLRNLAFVAALLTLATNCEKEKNSCRECTFVIANGEAFPYKVSFTGTTEAAFTLQPGQIKNVSIPSGVSVTVIGDFQSPYAHSDFSKSYRCDGECGAVNVILRE